MVTGSTAGIGFATVKLLAAEGAAVFINGRTQKRIDDAIAQIKSEINNVELRGIPTDFSKHGDVTNLIKQVPGTTRFCIGHLPV